MIKKNWLIFENCLLWMVAGFNILRIGVNSAIADGSLVWLWSIVVFTAFAFMFFRVIKKNCDRIKAMEGEKAPFYKFMTVKGFATVIFMMTLGITLRKFTGLPISFFAYFYTGLGAALTIAGLSSLFRMKK